MIVKSTSQGLIMDLGVSEGNDTAYYISKGFQVIAVEADPIACEKLRIRFSDEIADGILDVLNFAASDRLGGTLDIFVHKIHQGISGIKKREYLDGDYMKHSVMTIDWRTLVAQAGVPRYLKIDVEGSEEPFLRGMRLQKERPEFISVECYSFLAIELLSEMGYKRFKFIDQNPPGGFQLPARQMEGLQINTVDFTHSSGPFGLDVFGDGNWMTLEEVRVAWIAGSAQFHRTWYDCHAWAPN